MDSIIDISVPYVIHPGVVVVFVQVTETYDHCFFLFGWSLLHCHSVSRQARSAKLVIKRISVFMSTKYT